MEQQHNQALNLQTVQAHISRYSRDVHPIVLQQSGVLPQHPDELKSIYDVLQLLHTSLARDLAMLQLHLRPPSNQTIRHKAMQRDIGPLSIGRLTCKEHQVLTMFAKGYSYTQTAKLLDCKLATVQTHAKHIYKKLNVHSRSEAVFEARQLDIIQL